MHFLTGANVCFRLFFISCVNFVAQWIFASLSLVLQLQLVSSAADFFNDFYIRFQSWNVRLCLPYHKELQCAATIPTTDRLVASGAMKDSDWSAAWPLDVALTLAGRKMSHSVLVSCSSTCNFVLWYVLLALLHYELHWRSTCENAHWDLFSWNNLTG